MEEQPTEDVPTVLNSDTPNQMNDAEVGIQLTSATENATNIIPKEASYEDQPAKYRDYGTPTYEKFSHYNRGWNGPKRENKEVNRNQDNLAIFDALAGQVELTDYQKAEGRRILTQLDLPNLGRSVDLVAFSVCILVANDDVHDGHRYWPTANDTCSEFTQIAENIGYDSNTILSVMLTVDARRDEGGV